MHLHRLGLALFFLGTTLFDPAVALGQPAQTPLPANVPKIIFEELVFDFGKVQPNETVGHNFFVTNTGNALLKITDVQPGCGCTTIEAWDREIPPGKAGKIPIRFSSGKFRGPISKGITVLCNDPAAPATMLNIRAKIWSPIDLDTFYAYFLPVEDELTNQTKVINILNNLEEPMTLQPPESSHAAFRAELKTIRPGKEFELRVTCIPAVVESSVQGRVTIETSVAEMPTLTITTFARLQSAIIARPEAIELPAGPLPDDFHAVTTIHTQTENAVKFSEATVAGADIKVEVRSIAENQTQLRLSFPSHFELAAGQSLELTVKTTHPKHPVLKLPIRSKPPKADIPPLQLLKSSPAK